MNSRGMRDLGVGGDGRGFLEGDDASLAADRTRWRLLLPGFVFIPTGVGSVIWVSVRRAGL